MNAIVNESLPVAPVAETLQGRIQKLLGQGLPTSVVASAVGCDPSYVSQLLENEEFKNTVLLTRATKAEGAVTRDGKWDKIEDMALEQAEKMLPLVTRPSDLVRLASMANSAKRRAAEYSGASETGAPVVNIILPAMAAVHFQINVNSQVVEIDGRSTAALPTKHLMEIVKDRRAARESKGTVSVEVSNFPTLQAPVETAVQITERKKVETILDRIGYADEIVPTPVKKIL